MTHVIPVGTSEPQDFALHQSIPGSGEATPVVGTGLDVELEIFSYEAGVVGDVATPPSVAWLSAAAGTVRVTGTEDLAVGTYLVRFKLEDLGGDIGFVPNTKAADVWSVVPVPNR